VHVRISTKLTLGLSLVSSCILGGYGFWLYGQEKRDLMTTAERDFTTLSTAVRIAVENSLRDKQTADIRRCWIPSKSRSRRSTSSSSIRTVT
jgi:hypothetical protein